MHCEKGNDLNIKKLQRTIFSGLGLQVLKIFVNMFLRVIFIRELGTQILGINSLFTNVITLISITELGMGGAITAYLYKPLAEHKYDEVSILMEIYKRVYRGISLSILLIGGIVAIFIPHFVTGYNGNLNLRLLFLLFVLNSSMSYLTAYRNAIITADRRGYIANLVYNITFVIQSILQYLALVTLQNYVVYLVISIFATLLQNSILNRIAVHDYNQIFVRKLKPSKKNYQSILDYVKPMMLYMLSGVVNNGTDNIIISKFLGVSVVGMYANYVIVVSALQSILQTVFSSMTAFVGREFYVDKNEGERIFRMINFIALWVTFLIAGGLLLFFNSFISWWVGRSMVLSSATVWVIVGNFILIGISQPLIVFREATGSFVHNQFKPVWSTVINIATSLVLVRFFGISGVLFGTIVARITTYFWNDPMVLYQKYFYKPVKQYFMAVIAMFGSFTGYVSIWHFAISPWIPNGRMSLLQLLVFGILYLVTFNIYSFVIFGRTVEVRKIKSLLNKKYQKDCD